MAHWIKHVRLNPTLQNKIVLIIGIVTALVVWILAEEYVVPLGNLVNKFIKLLKSKNLIQLDFGPTELLLIKAILVE